MVYDGISYGFDTPTGVNNERDDFPYRSCTGEARPRFTRPHCDNAVSLFRWKLCRSRLCLLPPLRNHSQILKTPVYLDVSYYVIPDLKRATRRPLRIDDAVGAEGSVASAH